MAEQCRSVVNKFKTRLLNSNIISRRRLQESQYINR